ILARRSDSVVPPRLGVAARLGSWLAALSPGLFAISNVFLLAPNHDTARGSSPLDGSRSEEGCRASDLR
ncbi:MAG TPA: hypothetical protein VK116_12080, partial [Planctomycetota bacterium]|nr:hypothetical protein [Planctomycetota bacterium]